MRHCSSIVRALTVLSVALYSDEGIGVTRQDSYTVGINVDGKLGSVESRTGGLTAF
jgi:hypothetical protein